MERRKGQGAVTRRRGISGVLRASAWAIAVAAPASLAAQEAVLHCLGREPGFMLVIEGDTARFDYLGDGVFDIDPPLMSPIDAFTRVELLTFGGPFPVFIERGACAAFGATLPFTVEVGVPSSAGQIPLIGCCRDATPPTEP